MMHLAGLTQRAGLTHWAWLTQRAGQATEHSDLDLRTQLHHGVGGQVQKFGCRAGVVVHLGEEFFAPGGHAAANRGNNDVP